jgi:pimeloyl-ACP methyl ester carboxylesterase
VRRGFLAASIVPGASTARQIAIADFEVVRSTDLTERLSSIACPITWVDGVDDGMVPASQRTNDRPGTIVSVPDAGHLLPIEAPAAIAEALA